MTKLQYYKENDNYIEVIISCRYATCNSDKEESEKVKNSIENWIRIKLKKLNERELK